MALKTHATLVGAFAALALFALPGCDDQDDRTGANSSGRAETPATTAPGAGPGNTTTTAPTGPTTGPATGTTGTGTRGTTGE